ncbi:MAG: class I SAM-dependent methyltransferase [Myxococcota bacterium]
MRYSTESVEQTLDGESVHREWKQLYRGSAGLRLDRILRRRALRCMKLPSRARILDAGCGPELRHSIPLAARGFRVDAIDVAEPVIESARRCAQMQAQGLQLTVQRDSLLELSAASETYDLVICAHVLMHVPEIQKACMELFRVVKPGGWLFVVENNADSLQEIVRNRFGVQFDDPMYELEGLVYAGKTAAGETYIARQLDVQWFCEFCRKQGVTLHRRWAREFTELYTVIDNPFAAGLVHRLNRTLFRLPGGAALALQNALLLRKTG